MYHVKLTCGHCRNLEQKDLIRCVQDHNAFAKRETPACSHFHRVPDVRFAAHEPILHLARRVGDIRR